MYEILPTMLGPSASNLLEPLILFVICIRYWIYIYIYRLQMMKIKKKQAEAELGQDQEEARVG